MAIETLDDIIDEIADKCAVYGAHTEEDGEVGSWDMFHCRVCFVSSFRQRIEAAVQIEAIMRRVTLGSQSDASAE